MWPTLPLELMPGILEYLDPDWAPALSKTSKELRRFLHQFYKNNARRLVHEKWHHRLCKRARNSIHGNISPTPRALASIIHRRCARCNNRFFGKIHFMGMAIHAFCIKSLLINVYFLRRDFALDADAFESLPQYKQVGFPHGLYVRVWKTGFLGIVPYEWTAHYLVFKNEALAAKWDNTRYPYWD